MLEIGACRKVGRILPWKTTKAFKLHHQLSEVYSPDSHVRLAQEMSVGKDERCILESWVAWRDAHAVYHIGRVAEIIQFQGSDAGNEGRADYVLLRKARVGERHDIYQMPHVTLLEDEVLICPQVSVQVVSNLST
jgi:hypothetical protein